MGDIPSWGQCEPRCRGENGQGILRTKNQVVCPGQRMEGPAGGGRGQACRVSRAWWNDSTPQLRLGFLCPHAATEASVGGGGRGRGGVQSSELRRLIWLQWWQPRDSLERRRGRDQLGDTAEVQAGGREGAGPTDSQVPIAGKARGGGQARRELSGGSHESPQ